MKQLQFTKEFQESIFLFLLRSFDEYGVMVEATAFTLEYLELAWGEVLTFHRDYRELPTWEVLQEAVLKSFPPGNKKRELLMEKFSQLREKPIRNKTYLQEQVVQFLRASKLARLGAYLQERVSTGEQMDFGELRKEVDNIARIGVGMEAPSYFDGAESRLLNYINGKPKELIPTGIDENLALARRELGVIIAPPKRGKTTALVAFGFGGLVHGYRVLHITLEVHAEELTMRYDRAITGFTKRMLRLADNFEGANKQLQKFSKLHGDLYVKEFLPNRFSPDDLYGILSQYAAKDNTPDLILVDYADLMRPLRKYDERRFEISGVYTELRALAAEFDAALWTASQTNRAGLDKEIITMADLAEDFGKAAIADKLVAFCQTAKEREMRPEQLRFFFAGGREEADGFIVPATVDRDLVRIRGVR